MNDVVASRIIKGNFYEQDGQSSMLNYFHLLELGNKHKESTIAADEEPTLYLNS